MSACACALPLSPCSMMLAAQPLPCTHSLPSKLPELFKKSSSIELELNVASQTDPLGVSQVTSCCA